MKPIYLDYNATTPVADSVREAMLPFFSRFYGNPSSSHALGRAAVEAIEDARMHVAAALGADRDEIFFTSGGTESNNLAILGSLYDGKGRMQGHAITTRIEHPAVLGPLAFAEKLGVQVTLLPSNSNGYVEPEAVKQALRPDTRLVSIMHANNETGVIQPVAEIAAIMQDRDIHLHSDAAQSFGKIATHVDELGVSMLSLAGHKCYAPKGIGVLYVRFGTHLHPVLQGANHERGLRPGTENVPGIVGMGQACRLIQRRLESIATRVSRLRDQLEEQLRLGVPGLLVNGQRAPRLPNTLSVSFPDVDAQELLKRAPEILASTGSACHSGGGVLSSTLVDLGLDRRSAGGTIRLSLGWHTTEPEIERAGQLLIQAWQQLLVQ